MILKLVSLVVAQAVIRSPGRGRAQAAHITAAIGERRQDGDNARTATRPGGQGSCMQRATVAFTAVAMSWPSGVSLSMLLVRACACGAGAGLRACVPRAPPPGRCVAVAACSRGRLFCCAACRCALCCVGSSEKSGRTRDIAALVRWTATSGWQPAVARSRVWPVATPTGVCFSCNELIA